MKKLFIVANIKSYKTEEEAKQWLNEFLELKKISGNFLNKEIIICPPFTLLLLFKSFISENSLPVKIGAQNLSPFDEGAYTGEVNAKQIKEFADFVLIGHSERRSNFSEDDNIIAKKIEQSIKNNLTPIFFVQTYNQLIPSGVKLIVYEPPSSISNVSGGIADEIDDVSKAAQTIKEKGSFEVLYGGSVNSANVKNFVQEQNLNGVVVGAASLDAKEFIQIIKNA